MYATEYNGIKSSEKGLYATRPNIPSPERVTKTYKIPGRSGDLIEYENEVYDITITVKYGFKCQQDQWGERFRQARKWLLADNGGILILQDDPEFYYKVKSVAIEEGERTVKAVGEFTANFLCEGCQYPREGLRKYPVSGVRYNNYWISKPTYLIKGDGMISITVNQKTVKANVSGDVVINTDVMLTYREDGTIRNTSITGKYEDLYLKPGENDIQVSNGFEVMVIPNWRCL